MLRTQVQLTSEQVRILKQLAADDDQNHQTNKKAGRQRIPLRPACSDTKQTDQRYSRTRLRRAAADFFFRRTLGFS
jgi:hypothetical protein